MVEAGQVDFACHANDAGWLLAEMKRLSRVLEVIEEFVRNNPDTLTILTADHETGGFGFSYSRDPAASTRDTDGSPSATVLNFLSSDSLKVLGTQREPLSANAARSDSNSRCALGFDGKFYPHHEYRDSASLGRCLGAKIGVVWSTGAHTTTPVPLFAHGPRSQEFRGWHLSSDIGSKLLGIVRSGGDGSSSQ